MNFKQSKYIDYDAAMDICEGDEEFLDTVTQCFLEEWQERKNRIYTSFAQEDWETYRINVHALKSGSLNIGAVALSEEAKAIEFAIKDGDFNFAKDNHAKCLNHLEELLLELN